jgi:hypothetical protein
MNCGRIAIGVSNVEKAEVLLDALLAMEDAKKKRPTERLFHNGSPLQSVSPGALDNG